MVYIYILKLKQGRYYVGKTLNAPAARLSTHFKYGGAAWTRKYKPVEVVDVIADCDAFDEDKYTKMYMAKYGIKNVRGGSFAQVKLGKPTIEVLKKMISSTEDRCFVCGDRGHFARNCTYAESSDDEEVWGCKVCYREFDSKATVLRHECWRSRSRSAVAARSSCSRCGRAGHYARSCYTRTHAHGYSLSCDDSDCSSSGDERCRRCGRDHPTSNCYASTHIDGNILLY